MTSFEIQGWQNAISMAFRLEHVFVPSPYGPSKYEDMEYVFNGTYDAPSPDQRTWSWRGQPSGENNPTGELIP